MKMKIRDSHPSIEKEIRSMKENWQIWIEKIRFATLQVLPHSQIHLEKRYNDEELIITITIEVDTLPQERFMINNIINEILRRAELPIYNPFHIVLRSSENGEKIEISKPW